MRILAVLAVALMLAGCADDAPAAPDEDDGLDVGATDTTGGIRGVVYDASIFPVSGARVAIDSLGQETATDADGNFVFSGLAPGTYFLQVGKLGYISVQQSAIVEAGVERPPVVQVQLLADTENQPSAPTISYTGYLQCGAGVPEVGSLNPCAATGSVNVFGVPVDRSPDYVQIEMVWQGTNALGDGLRLGIYDPDTLASNFVDAEGGSPLILKVTQDEMEDALGDDYQNYTVRVFPGAGEPSLVVEQEFTIFVTNFYGFVPQEDWLFIQDGQYVIA